MGSSANFTAAIAYVPIIGWLVAFLTQRRNGFVMFHLRQAVGLVGFLFLSVIAWVVFMVVVSWIPYGFLIANALFALVVAAFIYGAIALVIGIVNASRGKVALLPLFGRTANRILAGPKPARAS